MAGQGVLHFADDLDQSLQYGDAAYGGFLDKVDSFVERSGMKLAPEPEARARRPDPPCITEPLRHLDCGAIGLGSVIWATGYTFDFGWIDLSVLDQSGRPEHKHGIAVVPGLYFLGLPWLSKMNSSFLSGVGDDAARLADCIERAADQGSMTTGIELQC